MRYRNLERFEKQKAQERLADREATARRALKEAVKDVLPARLKVPQRGKGRTPQGGISRREVGLLRAKAARFLQGAAGLRELEAEVQLTAIVILLIDGQIGTEPWRAAGGPHGPLVAANARLRYLENAARLLADLRASRVGEEPKLLEGVIDAEPVEEERSAAPEEPEP